MNRLAGAAAIVIGFIALAAMRSTAPYYVQITRPIGYAGKPGQEVRADNLVVQGGTPLLARKIRYKAAGKVETRDSGGLWLVVPVVTRVERETAKVFGRVWQTPDGRSYNSSMRVESADTALTSTKVLQPGLVRKNDVVVFELPAGTGTAGTLLLSEDMDPQLAAQARIAYPATPSAQPVALLDLDELHAKP